MIYEKLIVAEGNMDFEIRFLLGAVGNDETRYAMKYIHVEPSEKEEGRFLGVSTDGRHLHLVDPLDIAFGKVFGLTPGFWQVFKGSKGKEILIARLADTQTENWVFPNWRIVIPNGDVDYSTVFKGFGFKGRDVSAFSHLATFIHDFPEITAIDLRYLESLGKNFEWKVEWRGNSKPIVFTDHNRMALIQPMQTA